MEGGGGLIFIDPAAAATPPCVAGSALASVSADACGER